MAKYISLHQEPKANVCYESALGLNVLPELFVYESSTAPEYTGIVDASGVKIYRVISKPRMGF